MDVRSLHEESPSDRLDGWKEIAAYLKRDVTTVQRWEKREGMPVRRHLHDKLGSVYAFRSELDTWAGSRHPELTPSGDTTNGPVDPQRQGRLPFVVWVPALVILTALAFGVFRLRSLDRFWNDPIAGATFEILTDFPGVEEAANISRDGKFVAFLSDRDGPMDVWVTQIGTGQFYNLTRGRFRDVANRSLRTVGFSPDGSLVTFWARVDGTDPAAISVWAVPTLGGEPRPYLEGIAEFDWLPGSSDLVYHTTGPGDPMFVSASGKRDDARQIFVAAPGLHGHFPRWSPDGSFVYFVQGTLPDALDIWRVPAGGGAAERITSHNSRVSHPVLLDNGNLMYLASDADGAGPWIFVMNVDRRVPHRLGTVLDRYTSLAASADGSRLVATLASPKGSLWRAAIGATAVDSSQLAQVSLTTGRGFAPRLGDGFLLYVSSKGTSDSIWKLKDGAASELWSAQDAHVVGGPELTPDGRRMAFSVDLHGRTMLISMNTDGTHAGVVSDSLRLRGAPAWSPDGESITTAADVDGAPGLFRISLDGRTTPFVHEYSVDPAWSPRGDFVVFSGPDIGTTFRLKAVTAALQPHPFPDISLTRGGRRLRLLRDGRSVVLMRGELEHKDLWIVDLGSGAERQLTNLPADFNLKDFDISQDGRELVLERRQQESDVVLIAREYGQ